MRNQLEQLKKLNEQINELQKGLSKEEIKKCICDGNNKEFCKRLKRKK